MRPPPAALKRRHATFANSEMSNLIGINTIGSMDQEGSFERFPVSPSSLSYRDRLTMRGSAELSAILSQNKGKNVWSRLSYDAAIRQTSKSRALRPTPAEASIFYAGNDLTKRPQTSDSYISGFVTNTYPVVFNRDLTFRSGHLKVPGDVSLDTATNEQLKKMKTKAPIEFFSVVRPDCETTSQTMRMMGTYKDDYGIANRTDTLIPSGCPGPQGINWHPDVSVTLSETRRGSRTANIMF